MSGIKLTVLLPVLNQLIRDCAVMQSTGSKEAQAVVILCHSAMRCSEIEGFLKELLIFCKEVVEIVDVYSGDDKIENALRLKQSLIAKEDRDVKKLIKSLCKVIVATPSTYLDVLNAPKQHRSDVALQISSIILDKVEMHIALELTNELLKIAELIEKPTFKTIITT
jgi:hypothetical protein